MPVFVIVPRKATKAVRKESLGILDIMRHIKSSTDDRSTTSHLSLESDLSSLRVKNTPPANSVFCLVCACTHVISLVRSQLAIRNCMFESRVG